MPPLLDLVHLRDKRRASLVQNGLDLDWAGVRHVSDLRNAHLGVSEPAVVQVLIQRRTEQGVSALAALAQWNSFGAIHVLTPGPRRPVGNVDGQCVL